MKSFYDTNYDEDLSFYMEEISKYQLLSYEEEIALAKKIKTGCVKSRQNLINANLRLVVKMARSYKLSGISLMDLIQEGNLGLIKAVEKYDDQREVRFCTYASWWIKQAISRFLSDKSRHIRLPYRKEEALRIIQRFIDEYTNQYHIHPSVTDIVFATGIKRKDVVSMLEYSSIPLSIYSETPVENGILLDIIEDNSYDPTSSFLKACVAKDTRQSLDVLSHKERDILKFRYNFIDDKKYTLKIISEMMDISPETVRQIEMRALRKLKAEVPRLQEYMVNL